MTLLAQRNKHTTRIQTSSTPSLALCWLLSLAFLLSPLSLSLNADPIRAEHLEVELIAEYDAIVPGEPLSVAFRFVLDPDWHLYWLNPGDAGLAPRVFWSLPEGFTVGELQFPAPRRIPAGPLVSFGFDEELILLCEITPPTDLEVGQNVSLSAEVDWLVCRVECIPGIAQLTLQLPIVNDTPSYSEENHKIFARARERLPIVTERITASGEAYERQLILRFNLPRDFPVDTSLYFFPQQKGIIDNSARPAVDYDSSGVTLTIARASVYTDRVEHLTGLLVGGKESDLHRGLAVSIPIDDRATPAPMTATIGGLLQALVFAFIGGLLLNLMPCVLPVLSLKILGFVQQVNHSNIETLKHSGLFLSGVLLSFWVLAGVMLIVRAGGAHLGWGYQLQSPAFIVILASFMFLMALNLFGVFEVGSSLTGIGARTSRGGAIGSFVSGITATVVATPCTAPFMGTALGFSLSQPPFVTLAIFTMLGTGMAAPFVLGTNIPALVRFIPKPGRWMETLKQFMGFLLAATVIWLIWVLGVQGGIDAVTLLLGALLVAALAAWILNRWGALAVQTSKRMTARAAAAVLVVAAVGFAAVNAQEMSPGTNTIQRQGNLSWEPYSDSLISELRNQGQPVLIDFTAAWCLSCQVNERVTFGSSTVQERLRELNVATVKADWTNRDAEITQALARYGRNSVPLYVLYTGGQNGSPMLLPEILTPTIVLEALEKIDG